MYDFVLTNSSGMYLYGNENQRMSDNCPAYAFEKSEYIERTGATSSVRETNGDISAYSGMAFGKRALRVCTRSYRYMNTRAA